MTPPDARQVAEQLYTDSVRFDDRGHTEAECRAWLIEAITHALSEATARLEAERDEYKTALQSSMRDLDSERTRRVAAQEAITKTGGYLDQLSEARRQVWEEAALIAESWLHVEPEELIAKYSNGTARGIARELRQRAQPPAQTETH